MDELSAKLYVGNKGAKAADFTYPDRNGKLVSLSDFKGKWSWWMFGQLGVVLVGKRYRI